MRILGLKKLKEMPLRRHWLLFAGFCLLAYLLFVHPDIVETSNHSYVLLDSLFKGRFFQFYNDVMARPFGTYLYYTNFAHYNILVYILFALAELPVYIFNAIFGTYNEAVFYYVGKLVSAGFYFACIPQVQKLALQLGVSEEHSHWAALFFALMPPVFFSSMVMGQYDTICLLFILLGVRQWLKGNHMACALLLGAGACAKFFSLLLLVPLILLSEKRPLHILKYGLVSLWLVVPTGLLFMGRTGDMGAFNNLMLARLFSVRMPAASDVPIFPMLYFVLCVAAYLYKPKDDAAKNRGGIWLCLCALGLLFFFIDWHPQWLVLLAPFMVLTTFMEKNKAPWFFVDIAFSAGFFLLCAFRYAHALEANLLDGGLIGIISGLQTTAQAYQPISFYLLLVPVLSSLPMVLFGGGLAAHVGFKLPLPGGTPATRLSGDAKTPAKALPVYLWLVFGLGMAVWLVPTLFTWLKCFSFL